MQEFDNLIRCCEHQFNALPFCQQCQMSKCRQCGRNDCYNCLQYIHSICTKNEHYACEKITYNYILKYGYRYVSEMAWAFLSVKNLFNLQQPINIFSVGCGPSTELYGAAVVFRNTPLDYSGFDLSNTWHPMQQYNMSNLGNAVRYIHYYNTDFIQYVINSNACCDILVLNYFFSDFIKYQPQKCETFIDELVKLIQQGRFTTIIINDIMLLYNSGTAYYCMKKIARSLRNTQNLMFQYQRRHFAFPNRWQFPYGEKLKDSIGFKPIIPEALPFEPFTTCGSIQLIIKTNRIQQP